MIQEDKSATLSCNNDQTLFVPTQTENGEVIYLARKLTPTECASLQGFEKDWCALVPHKDSAEYKMWGNGMAFPCMLYIMEGVQELLYANQQACKPPLPQSEVELIVNSVTRYRR